MNIETALLSAAFIVIVAYIIYKIMDEAKNIDVEMTKDRLIENSRYIERKIEELVVIDKKWFIKKYRDMMRQSRLSRFYINLYILAVISLFLAFLSYKYFSNIFNQVLAGLLMACVTFAIPFVGLEIEVTLNNRKIRQHMPHFLLMFLQTADVMGDSIKALQTIKEEVKEPIKGYIKEFVHDLGKGMGNREAVDILKSRSHNMVWHSFCENLFMDLEYGKMIQTDIEKNIKEAFTHQENYMHRITENTGSLTSVGIILVVCGFGLKKVVDINEDFFYIIRNNREGHIVVNVVIIILVIVSFLAKSSISYTDD